MFIINVCYSVGMQQLHGNFSVMVSNKIGESDLNTEVTLQWDIILDWARVNVLLK